MGARGEGTLRVGDREVRLLFTNRALARAESALGKTVIEIARNAATGNIGLNDTVELLRLGIEAARRENNESGKPVNINEAYELIDGVGFIEAARVVIEALSDVLSYRGEATDDPNR